MISLLQTGGQEPQGIMKMLAELASLSAAVCPNLAFAVVLKQLTVCPTAEKAYRGVNMLK